MGVAKFDKTTEGQLKKIIDDGIASFKIFLAYKYFFGISDTELQQKLLREGKTGPEYHEPSREDFTKIPNGIPAIKDRVNLLYTYGAARGRLDIHRFVDAASTRTAKLFGMFPKKGTIQVGSDADLVIYDPDCRGKVSFQNGKFIGATTWGRLIRREATHY